MLGKTNRSGFQCLEKLEHVLQELAGGGKKFAFLVAARVPRAGVGGVPPPVKAGGTPASPAGGTPAATTLPPGFLAAANNVRHDSSPALQRRE